MVLILVASLIDQASMNIKQCLLEQSSWLEITTLFNNAVFQHDSIKDVYLLTLSDRKITHEHLEKEITNTLGLVPQQAIFLSRHRSETGKPSLTVHPIGNYGSAEFGGKPQTLVPSTPKLMTQLLRTMKTYLQKTTLSFEVCYEVTHHGPYLKIPTCFIEVGSTELEWKKKQPAAIIAQTLLDVLPNSRYEKDFSKDIPVLIGIGGGHYAPRFTDIAFEKNAAFGHMIPSYQINAGTINKSMIQQALEATPNVSGVYFHKKALKKSQVTQYKQLCEEIDVPVISSKTLPSLL